MTLQLPQPTDMTLIRRFVKLGPDEQANLVLGLFRGALHHRKFDTGRYVAAGREVWIQKRFGEIHLGSFVELGTGVGLGVVGREPGDQAILRIGSHTRIQTRTHINCEVAISIGDHCAISWDVEILDTDIHTIIADDGRPLPNRAPVIIEDRVWIGTRAIILKGVTVGHDSIVAAGSVVTQSIPPNSLCAGNPARVIRQVRGWQA
jgi:acetyltransferase-like isoleucine patch superfamily enzyme